MLRLQRARRARVAASVLGDLARCYLDYFERMIAEGREEDAAEAMLTASVLCDLAGCLTQEGRL